MYQLKLGTFPFRLAFNSLPDLFSFFFDRKYESLFSESYLSELEFLYGEIYSVVIVSGSVTTEFFHCFRYLVKDRVFSLNDELPF